MKNKHYWILIFLLMTSFVRLASQNWGTIYQNAESLTIGGIAMPNDSTIWIIGHETYIQNSSFLRGSSGQFYRTANGGNTWQAGTITEGELFITSISAVNSQTAWASVVDNNEGSAIYKTTNGGTTWQMTSAPFSRRSFSNFVHFWNAKEGVTMGDPLNGIFEIYLTGNVAILGRLSLIQICHDRTIFLNMVTTISIQLSETMSGFSQPLQGCTTHRIKGQLGKSLIHN